MKKILRFWICVGMFPADLFRLMVDAWRFTLEGYAHRHIYQNPDQPCIFCRDCDTGRIPRPMMHRIRYWNLWMPRLLHPQLVLAEPRRGLRKVPVCRVEGGYIYTPAYLPVLAVVTSGIWLGLLLWALWATQLIPPEVQEQILAWLG